jgi:glycosyltransferase involved in cell wall biosynthesis
VFIGWEPSEELPDYYNTADVFVGPSVVGSKGWQEALGLVFIEALATGLPVISTNTGGIADVVEDGVTGYLVDQRSSEQIARRLQALYEDRAPLQELSRHGRATVERRFSWDTVTSAYARVFVELSK